MIGFLNIDKPAGMTSHDVINRIRKILKIKHVGHGGTLDPMAVGVLPVAIGSACRLLRFLPHDKVYLAEVLLGVKTETDDIEGKVLSRVEVDNHFTGEQITTALRQFVGEIEQTPPAYSAIHHEGKRLYELARAGNIPDEIKPRAVTIQSIDLLDYVHPVVKIRITCGAGTYIRSIARDFGEKLGGCACLQMLVRERSGPFELGNAITLDEAIDYERLAAMIQPPQLLLGKSQDFVPVTISGGEGRSLRMGRKLPLAGERLGHPALVSGKLVLAICADSLVALCKPEADGECNWMLKPEVVIPHAE